MDWAPFQCGECGQWVNAEQAWLWSQVAAAAVCRRLAYVLSSEMSVRLEEDLSWLDRECDTWGY